MPDIWVKLNEWPTLYLERLEGEGVARVTLNRPEKRNSLTGELMDAFTDALEIVRADRNLKVVITRGAGPVFSSGLDLNFLRSVSVGEISTSSSNPPGDWDRPTKTTKLIEALRQYPRIMIAQVHGYCLGGALALMNAHDLVIAANDAQLGMPEVLRGSFGMIATSTLFHAQVPIKKAAWIQITGKNVSGAEADRLGLVSHAVDASELEATTTEVAKEIGSRHLAPLEHAKIAAQVGRDLSLTEAIQVDLLVGSRQALAIDPTGDVSNYLRSQKGGANLGYRRPDIK
jgi:enoyl-CoA hydratase/carnithine racemase